jgi:dihydrofolate reductase
VDGFIARPSAVADWILRDPAIDFNPFYRQFDTILLGRRTYEFAKGAGGGSSTPGMHVFIFSRTRRQEDHPVPIVHDP